MGDAVEELTAVEGKMQMKEFIEASWITNYLTSIYPNFRWQAAVDFNNGIIKFIEANLMDTTTPYVLRLSEVTNQKNLQKRLMLAAGEILERFYLPRYRQSVKTIESQMEVLDKDLRGYAILDKRGIPNWFGEKSNER